MAEVLSTFNIKYGRFYEVRNRYQLQSVHAWGTTCFKKEDVERVIGLYNEEQGKNISDDWYTCFDIMKLYGLGKTQVRRFAETHGVRIRKFKGGRANYYLKADWEAARKKAEKAVLRPRQNGSETQVKRWFKQTHIRPMPLQLLCSTHPCRSKQTHNAE